MNKTRTIGLAVLIIGLGIAGVIFWEPDTPPQSSPPVAEEKAPEIEVPTALPTPKLGPPAVKEVSVDSERHRFVERSYNPPYSLPKYDAPVPPQRLQSVEDTLAVYTSAIRHADWDWWFSMWDAKGQNKIKQMIAVTTGQPNGGNYKSDILAVWQKFYADRTQELVSRIELPGYTIVYLRREGEPDDSRELLAPVVLKKDGERWVMTHDLQQHIVPNLRITDRNVQVRTIQ